MKKMLLLSIAALLGIFCINSSLFSAPASAEEADQPKSPVWLQVSPVSKRLYLKAGTTHSDEFTVENIGSEDFTFNVYSSPYNVVGESYNLNFTEETKYTQIARWIKFEQSEYPLAVGQKQTVKFTVEVPADPPAGGQYATIFAESDGTEGEQMQSSGIRTVSRIGLVVYADLGGQTVNSAELVEYSFPTLYFSGNLTAASKIKNAGNTDFEARYHMDIRPLIGDVIFEKDETQAIFPETERRIEYVWDQTPLLGIFKVNFSVSAPGIDRSESHLVIIVPVFIIIITVLLLTFITIWIILSVKRRKGLQKRMHISE